MALGYDGFTPHTLNRLPVSQATRRRWLRRRILPSLAALAARLLEGHLGEVSPHWAGWRVTPAGELVSPEGLLWNASALSAWHYERQELCALRVKLRDPQQWRLL